MLLDVNYERILQQRQRQFEEEFNESDREFKEGKKEWDKYWKDDEKKEREKSTAHDEFLHRLERESQMCQREIEDFIKEQQQRLKTRIEKTQQLVRIIYHCDMATNDVDRIERQI